MTGEKTVVRDQNTNMYCRIGEFDSFFFLSNILWFVPPLPRSPRLLLLLCIILLYPANFNYRRKRIKSIRYDGFEKKPPPPSFHRRCCRFYCMKEDLVQSWLHHHRGLLHETRRVCNLLAYYTILE